MSETSDAVVESTSSSSPRVKRRRKKILDDRSPNSDLLPTDLIMEILKRLPVQTLFRFCVWKQWASIIRGRYFMKMFLAESSSRPCRLFFGFKRERECFLFSLLQSPNPGEASAATYKMTHPAYSFTVNTSFLHGLFCYGTTASSESCGLEVYNSSTRISITLPKFNPHRHVFKNFLGYDPIDGVYKVLCMTRPGTCFGMVESEYSLQVLTLGNGNSWKMIDNNPTQIPLNSHICINGVLYYDAYVDKDFKEAAVMGFDVRSENLDLIKGPCDCRLKRKSAMMTRYEGKLAIMSSVISPNGDMVLWVLEDAVKHEWSKKIFILPNTWTSLVQCTLTYHRFVNITDAGEFILAPRSLLVPPYYVLQYDPKRQLVRKVVIQGITQHCRNDRPCLLSYLFSTQLKSLMFL